MTVGTRTRYASGQLVETKTWSGADGKYDSVGRLRWNQYQMDGRRYTFQLADAPYQNQVVCDPTVGVRNLLDSNSQIQLLGKLQEKVRGHAFNAGVFLATGKQTLDLAGSTVLKCFNALRSLRKGHVTDAVRALGMSGKGTRNYPRRLEWGDVSSLWLEMQYGWLPLLSDVYEAGQAWEQANQTIVPYEVSASVFRGAEPQLVVVNLNGGWSGSETFTGYTHAKKIKLRMTSSEASARTIGLQDPGSIVWELLPWSFVADWFIPIGDYISVCNQMPMFDGKEFLTTEVRTAFRSRTVFMDTALYWFEGEPVARTRHSAFGSCTAKSLTRGKASPGIVPMPGFKPISAAASFAHIANGMALIHQLSKK